MIDIFADFFQWMRSLSPLWMYGVILLITYLENVVPPIPGDLIVVFAGYLVALGSLNFIAVVVISTVGGAIGFMSMYAVGFMMGRAVLAPDRLVWLPKKRIYRAQEWMERYGYGIVAANRFLSGARSVISLTVGMAQMAPGPVAVYASLSALVWTALLTALGYVVGENWRVIGDYLSQYGWFVLAVLGLYIAFRLGRYTWRRIGESGNDSACTESFGEPD
jgi:membrane protein DedA with SNARE-associated domain